MTTVNAAGQAQASPVWYIVEEDTLLVYSLANGPRTRNIAANPRVALNLNSSETGGDLVIIEGEARIIEDGPTAAQSPAYLAKYTAEMAALKMTPDSFSRDYPVRIHIQPKRLRAS